MNGQGTPMAVIYDFDGTLAPGRMQDRRFIPDMGVDVEEFWNEVNRTTAQHGADPILCYMHVMLKKSREAGIEVRREDLEARGRETAFFPGVESWFGRCNGYARERGVNLEHYVVSSGNSEIIEGTSVAGEFRRIYASRFLYDERGVAVWPAVAINFTTKTQYLFRINKGALDETDLPLINKYVPHSQRAVPFGSMVYVGDGETDVPCFRVMRDMGGLSLAVHDEGQRENALQYLHDGRVDAVAPADYRACQALEDIVRRRIDLVSAQHHLDQTMNRTMYQKMDPGIRA